MTTAAPKKKLTTSAILPTVPALSAATWPVLSE